MYRILVVSGKLKQLTPVSGFAHQPSYFVYNGVKFESTKIPSPFFAKKIEELLNYQFRLFFDQPLSLGAWKNWCFHEEESNKEHWTASPINSILGNDIKLTWDLSRFQWLIESSLAFRYTGNPKLLEVIELQLKSWCESNKKNEGVNWVCGQECAIRTLHFIISTELLSSVCRQNKDFIVEFIVSHLRRIDASLIYSISQDNNHGVTESAVLYIGALYLDNEQLCCASNTELVKWRKKGKKFFINRIKRLVLKDGGFAMYSSNYHRSVLNLLVMVKVLEARYTKHGIGELLYSQARKMIVWLEALADVNSGEFSNLGTNDGSAPFIPQLSSFRCLKDTLDAANFVFNGISRFNTTGELFYFLNALGVEGVPKLNPLKPSSRNFTQSGLMHLREPNSGVTAYVKYPVYKFRPAQSDLLHVDVWWDGVNIARDLGTYSYNCHKERDYYDILSSISSHNTIQFGDYDGMPKLGKFLYSNWPSLKFQKYSDSFWHGAYETYFGGYHERKVSVLEETVFIEDLARSDCDKAILRWHVPGMGWLVEGNRVKCKDIELILSANTELTISISMVNESLFYLKLEPVTSIEVSFKPKDASITSTFKVLK